MRECPRCGACLDESSEVCPEDGVATVVEIPGSPVLDGRYRLLRSLGAGGMGRVYEARHLGVERSFAVKVLSPRTSVRRGALERFAAEAKALGRLEHEHVVQVTDSGFDRERELPFLVMRLAEGRTLSDRLDEVGFLPPPEALPLLEQIAAAIDFAHCAGVVHRDLKPSNVLLERRATDEPERALVIDFGLASLGNVLAIDESESLADARRADDESEGQSARTELHRVPGRSSAVRKVGRIPVAGTPDYLAPEILAGKHVTHRADLYSFGVLAYRVLTGSRPFSGTLGEILRHHLETRPDPPSSVRPELDGSLDGPILALLEKDPERRPATAGAAVGDLRRAIEDLASARKQRRERGRRMVATVAFALVAPVLAAVLAVPLSDLERRSYDARIRLSTPRPVDPRLALVVLDESSLAADPTPLAESADRFGEVLGAALDAGARGVAVDFLLPDRWSRSRPFVDLLLEHPEQVVLAVYSEPGGEVIGAGAVSGFAAGILGSEGTRRILGPVEAVPDPDGVVRRLRSSWTDRAGRLWPGFATRAAEILTGVSAAHPREYRVDFRIDAETIDRISWRDLPGMIETVPDRVKDRLLLVGADYAGSGDRHLRTPRPGGGADEMLGTAILLLAVQTLAEDRPLRMASAVWAPFSVALLAALAASIALRAGRSAPILCWVGCVAFLVLSMGLFSLRGTVVPTAAPTAALAAVTGGALWLRWRWSERSSGSRVGTVELSVPID